MRGFLSLDPDEETLTRLVATQNRLRSAVSRQGVHFVEVERLPPVLLTWPFATSPEIEEIPTFEIEISETIRLESLQSRPNDERPSEFGFTMHGVASLQSSLFQGLRVILDPDPLQPAFVRLARVSPPSRKVGAAIRSSHLLGQGEGPFKAISLTIWKQNPTGFEPCRTMPLIYGGP